MTDETNDRDHRSRRAVLRDGAVALSVLFVVGGLVMVPAIQRDLQHAVNDALDAEGIVARADFRGQDATLRCVDQLDDPDAAHDVAAGVDGVRNVRLDVSCLVPAEIGPEGPVEGQRTTTTTVPASSTSSAPTTTAAATTTVATTTTAVDGPEAVVSVSLDSGRFTLDGTVGSAEQRAALEEAAAAAVGATNVLGALAVDTDLALDDADVSSIAVVIAAMPVPLVRGTVSWTGDEVAVTGVYVDNDAYEAFRDAAEGSATLADLRLRPDAAPADATAVQQELNELVAATPIVFGKGEVTVSPESAALLQQVAGVAKRFGGVVVEVQGHTDSEGDPGRNLTLSEQRAAAVAAELVRLGVPSDDVTSKGFGETQLVVDENGVEIPEQSRRVVFGVTTS
jgi:OOP family OmpA-OmpF porin